MFDSLAVLFFPVVFQVVVFFFFFFLVALEVDTSSKVASELMQVFLIFYSLTKPEHLYQLRCHLG
jgi:hypothetical protein